MGAEHLVDETGFEAAEAALVKLLKYTQLHFASEEKLLSEHGYPGLESHKNKHHELETSVRKMLDEIRGNRISLTPLKLNLFATVWLFEHIARDDEKFARYVLGKATPAQPAGPADRISAIQSR